MLTWLSKVAATFLAWLVTSFVSAWARGKTAERERKADEDMVETRRDVGGMSDDELDRELRKYVDPDTGEPRQPR